MERMEGKRSSDGNTSSGSESHLAHVEETRFARSRDAVTVRARGETKAKAPPRIIQTRRHLPVMRFLEIDPNVLDIRKDKPTACLEAINVLLAISASKGREKWTLLTADVQAAFLKGEFQEKDRVLCSWPPKNGTALSGVQPGRLLLIAKGVFGFE